VASWVLAHQGVITCAREAAIGNPAPSATLNLALLDERTDRSQGNTPLIETGRFC
jgi:hypothetical protein